MDLFVDGVVGYYIAASFALGILVFSVPQLLGVRPFPVLATSLALLLVAFCVWRIFLTVPELRQFRLGVDGEKAVGQYLERLRKDGANVFHDIPADGFNLDHVVIHRSGIYLIETKTYSKPTFRRAEIIFDGEAILVDGHSPDRDPVAQAQSGARWLNGVLRESTGKSFQVQPVIVFPGWWVESTVGAQSSGVWVHNPKRLMRVLLNSRSRMPPEDVSLCTFHLSRFVRGAVK